MLLTIACVMPDSLVRHAPNALPGHSKQRQETLHVRRAPQILPVLIPDGNVVLALNRMRLERDALRVRQTNSSHQ
jgi:hypothetical protein